jgi:hypothetical protein
MKRRPKLASPAWPLRPFRGREHTNHGRARHFLAHAMLLPLLAGFVVLESSTGLAGASGQPVVNVAQTGSFGPFTNADVDPCTNLPVLLTSTGHFAFHNMVQPDGTQHFTVTNKATFSWVPLIDGEGELAATGTYAFWEGWNGPVSFDQNGNPLFGGNGEFGFTFDGSGTYADGKAFRFHAAAHAVANRGGQILAPPSFSKAQCNGR